VRRQSAGIATLDLAWDRIGHIEHSVIIADFRCLPVALDLVGRLSTAIGYELLRCSAWSSCCEGVAAAECFGCL
jgi:hypothetical protein